MGIIERQGSKHSIVQILGVGIGALSTLFIYPLDTGLYGFAQFLVAMALLVMPISNLGIHALVVKFFPRLKDHPDGLSSFLTYVILTSGLLFLVFSALFVLVKPELIQLLEKWSFDNVNLLADYYYEIIIIIGLTTLIYVAKQQAMNLRRIVWPAVLWDISFKVFLPICVLLSVFQWMTFDAYVWYYVAYLVVVVLGLFYYIYTVRPWRPNLDISILRQKFQWRELTQYSLFSSVSKLGTMLIFKIDAFMITLILGASANGVFFIFLFMASVIHIPFKSINLIAAPIVSEAWENGDFDHLRDVYQKASLNLTIISFGLFLIIWSLLPSLIPFLPNSTELVVGISFFIYLGLAKVVDAVTSVNEQILIYSPIYYVHVFLIALVGVMNVLLNYSLIQSMGIAGVALASFISFFTYNFLKLILIYIRFRIQPFTMSWLKIGLLVALTWVLLYFAQDIPNLYLRVLVIGAILFSVYLLPLLRWSISKDFNRLFFRFAPFLKFIQP